MFREPATSCTRRIAEIHNIHPSTRWFDGSARSPAWLVPIIGKRYRIVLGHKTAQVLVQSAGVIPTPDITDLANAASEIVCPNDLPGRERDFYLVLDSRNTAWVANPFSVRGPRRDLNHQ